MRHAILALTALALAGCATLVNGGADQEVAFDTAPTGASVAVAGVGSCTTPCSLSMFRNRDYTAVYTKQGCFPVERRIAPVFDSALYYAIIPDFWTGAAYDLAPNPAHVKLLCGVTDSVQAR